MKPSVRIAATSVIGQPAPAPVGVLCAAALYAVWTAATWLLEGRIGTLLRPDALMARIAYAFVANLGVGIVGGIALLAYVGRRRLHGAWPAGFGPMRRAALGVAAGAGLGMAAYFLQGAPSTDPVVVVNAFAQVLVVSAAEVVVCWSLVGGSVRAVLTDRGGAAAIAAIAAAAVAASILFGLYHYAHSPPFNALPMVALLTAVGMVTSVFFFLSRDVAGTIVFHNFLGTFGVVDALSKANALAPMEVLQPPLLFTAALTVAAVAAGYFVLGSAQAAD